MERDSARTGNVISATLILMERGLRNGGGDGKAMFSVQTIANPMNHPWCMRPASMCRLGMQGVLHHGGFSFDEAASPVADYSLTIGRS